MLEELWLRMWSHICIQQHIKCIFLSDQSYHCMVIVRLQFPGDEEGEFLAHDFFHPSFDSESILWILSFVFNFSVHVFNSSCRMCILYLSPGKTYSFLPGIAKCNSQIFHFLPYSLLGSRNLFISIKWRYRSCIHCSSICSNMPWTFLESVPLSQWFPTLFYNVPDLFPLPIQLCIY